MRLLVLSPHLDDAVLSVGETLAAHPGSVVATVFAGVPRSAPPNSFDANCGFADPRRAVVARWHEDDRALAQLGAEPIRLAALDGQYGESAYREGLLARLIALADAVGPNIVLGPLGLMHPDHEALASIYLQMAALVAHQCWLYEDLPSRVTNPEAVSPALRRAQELGWRLDRIHLGGGDDASFRAKQAAVRAYRSQLWALPERVVFVPERCWRLTR